MGLLDNLWRRPADEPQRVITIDPTDARFRMEVKKAIMGSVVEIDDADDARALRLVAQPWQIEALGYRATLGEVRYASDFYARPMRRLRWYIGEIQDDGTIKETDNEIAKRTWARVRDPGGGNEGLVTEYGRLMFCTGEALLLYTPAHWVDELGRWVGDATGDTVDVDEEALIGTGDEEDDADYDPLAPERRYTPESWEMLSTAELRPDASGLFFRFSAGGSLPGEPLIPGSRVYRLWQRDAAYSELADAPMRAVLTLCEELAILTLVVRARGIARLAGNGLLFIPTDITLSAPPNKTVGDENPQEDPLYAQIIKALIAPIEDQGNASAVAPLLLRGPAEAGAQIRWIKVRDSEEVFPENALRDQTIHRLFLGLDMPPESGEGVGNMNHWGGWQVERDAWRHAEPIARQFCGDMTSAYLIPALITEGLKPSEAERYVVAYDDSEILTNPDRGDDAKDALTLGAIGYKAYREAMGWDDEDAPPAEEIPLILQYLGKGALDKEVDPAPASEGDGAGGDSQETGAPEGDNPEDPAVPSPVASHNGDGRVAALSGAADVAVMRHREAAGASLRSTLSSSKEAAGELSQVPNTQLAARVTAARDRVMAMSGADLESLVGTREDPMGAFLAREGYSAAVGEAIGRLVRHHAARTLLDEAPAPFPMSALQAILDNG